MEIKKLNSLKEVKTSIHRKLYLLLLAVSVGSFLLAGLVLFAGLYVVKDTAQQTGNALGESVSQFAEKVAENQARNRMLMFIQEKSRRVDRELETTAGDVEYLSQLLTRMQQAPQNYVPRRLPDAHSRTIRSGQSYLNYSNKLARQVPRDTFAREEELLANISDAMDLMSDSYTAAFVGSKHGYVIAMDVIEKDKTLQFPPAYLEDYDPRETNWYKLGLAAKVPDFTDIYTNSSSGIRCVTCVLPFYDASGAIAGVVGIDCNAEDMFRQVYNISGKGQSDFDKNSFILNETGNILFSTRKSGVLAVSQTGEDLRKTTDPGLAAAAVNMVEGSQDVDLVKVDGEEYLLAYAPLRAADWSIGILIPKSEILNPVAFAKEHIDSQMKTYMETLNSRFGRVLLLLVALMVLLIAGISYISKKLSQRVVQPIVTLENGVKEIARGDLDRKIEIKREDEIGRLADSVNEMTVELKEYMNNLSQMTAEKEHIATELSVATNIQKGMLPPISQELAGNKHFDLYASMHPAKKVGGDFYDFYMVDEDHLAVTIADVSGKGVPAALFMAISKTILKNTVLSEEGQRNYARLLERANRQICENNEEMMFVTVFFGVLDLRSGHLTCVNCGHNAPLVCHSAAGGFDYLRLKHVGLVMGLEDMPYDAETIQLAPGDMLYLYTDGVTEAMNEEDALYTEARLQECLNRTGNSDAPVQEVLEEVQKDVKAFTGAASQSDDITMLGLRYLG